MNPIIEKEFWESIRKKRTFLVRPAYVLALLPPLVLAGWGWKDALASRSYFMILMWVQVALAVLLAPVFTAGTINSERRRLTLGALLLTELDRHEIVFGKYAPRVAYMSMIVMAALPVLALWTLFGSLEWSEILAGQAVVLGLAALGAAFGVFWSSLTTGAFPALVLSYACMLVAVAWAPLLRYAGLLPHSGLAAQILCTPPEVVADLFSAERALTGVSAAPRSWAACLIICLLPVAPLIRGAGSMLDPHLFASFRNRVMDATAAVGAAFRRAVPVDRVFSVFGSGWFARPIAWRETQASRTMGLRGAVALTFGAVALSIPMYVVFWRTWDDLRAHQVLLGVEFYAVCLMATVTAASSIASEKETRSLDILLTSPIRPHTIVWDKIIAITMVFWILLLPGAFHIALFTVLGRLSPGTLPVFLLVGPAAVAFYVAAGLFFSTGAKTQAGAQAMALALMHVFVLSGLLLCVPHPFFLFLPASPIPFAIEAVRPGPFIGTVVNLLGRKSDVDLFLLFLLSAAGVIASLLMTARIGQVLKDRFYKFVR